MTTNEHAAFEEQWQARVRALREAGPVLAAAKQLVLDDARRRGVMQQVRWIDIGLPSGELWPVAPPRFESDGPGIDLQGGNAFRQRR